MTRTDWLDFVLSMSDYKWPKPDKSSINIEHAGHRFTRAEFEQRAKELGWCSGYKYGVEYETNGKKPDLPDDVQVEQYSVADSRWNAGTVSLWNWGARSIIKFRIVDERYKPVEGVTSSEVERVQHNTNTTEFGKKDFPQDYSFIADAAKNSWYDYDKQQAIALPPVGVECEWSTNDGDNWHKTKLIFSDNTVLLTSAYHLYKIEDTDVLFRPLDWNRKADEERRKFVDRACNGMLTSKISNAQLKTIKRLYDLGCRFK